VDQHAAAAVRQDLVLVGAGHAHVQLLRGLMMTPLDGVRVTLIVDRHEAVYSGMVPGFVAGDYTRDALSIDALPLARRAAVRCIHAAATRIDPEARWIEVEGRPPIRYDVASLDVGSTIRAAKLPGASDHTLPTRPIGRFIAQVEHAIERSRDRDAPLRIALVGGGAAGVELALCLDARLRARGEAAAISVITSAGSLLLGSSNAMRKRAQAALRRRDVALMTDTEVVAARPGAVDVRRTGSREVSTVEADLTLWATGAAPHEFMLASPLPHNDAGFVRVTPTFQVEGHPTLFAAGDCAAMDAHPWVPRAGVYAVRAGPVLDHNLRAALAGRPLRAYRPQRDFLALLNLGGGEAIGGKWGFAHEGASVWRLKDRIDRRFMERFQVLDAEGRPASGFPAPMPEPEDPADAMACGGCAAKVGPSPLEDALARLPDALPDPSVQFGIAEADDAAAFATSGGDVLLASVDAFRAFTDDPWLVGRVAAVNAMSDIHAKGGLPHHALAMITVPDEGPTRSSETLYQVLAGVRSALDPLGVSLVGGHSTLGPDLFVGLSITGELPEGRSWIGLDGLVPGDALVLTKPIGTGILLAADMRGLATSRWMEPTFAAMQQENGTAIRIAESFALHACTDISGFGLAGHLLEMLRASQRRARLDLSALPALPGALQLIAGPLRSSYHAQNAVVRDQVAASPHGANQAAYELLFDPQTAGGLLFGLVNEDAGELVERLHAQGYADAAIIGQVEEVDEAADVASRIVWRS
jgi:selenide,water dikinase